MGPTLFQAMMEDIRNTGWLLEEVRDPCGLNIDEGTLGLLVNWHDPVNRKEYKWLEHATGQLPTEIPCVGGIEFHAHAWHDIFVNDATSPVWRGKWAFSGIFQTVQCPPKASHAEEMLLSSLTHLRNLTVGCYFLFSDSLLFWMT